MELQTGEYQKLQIRQYPQRTLRETAEGRYWKQFRGTKALQQVCADGCAGMAAATHFVSVHQGCRGTLTMHLCLPQIGGVTYIDFAAVYPFNYAVTSSTRVRPSAMHAQSMPRMHVHLKLLEFDSFPAKSELNSACCLPGAAVQWAHAAA